MSNYTILIIDYEPSSIERLKAPLERAGYQVEVARDGEFGIRRFHGLKPHAVIIEAMLPKRHGFEVCQELKNTPHGALCPVMIATSVYRGRKYRHQATHMYHCDEYLEKPIADEDLLRITEAMLQKYAERRRVAAAAEGGAAVVAMEIDTSLLSAEPELPRAPVVRAAPTPPPAAAPAPAPARQAQAQQAQVAATAAPASDDDFEFDIISRLDDLLSDDPSKSSPGGAK